MVLKPMETFFEEHIQFYLLDMTKNPLLRGVLKAIVEGKAELIESLVVGYSEEH
jgi:hypothetical protein